ncbi:unnamed protein product [Caenorhabditis auriculariae]|uniref:Uncharacterized protein n=1 Tax=Caenorhabditis auriculariae TaxID=2777116 RepID=A0A8S1H293_9PELO|nr:unnamed protein product [Caenorhabditis auriculariae]
MYCSTCSVLFALVGMAFALPLAKESAKDASFESFPFESFDGHFANMEVDGVEMPLPKKTEKLPGQKKTSKSAFDKQPIGVAPEFTGSFINEDSDDGNKKTKSSESDDDYFSEVQGPVTNPAATYLEGGNFDKVPAPKCQMLGCTGPVPNDGSYAVLSTAVDNKACGQTFVPLNGCTDNKGYPMGMLCSICCDCDNSFVAEMKKTFGYREGFTSSS